jgi:hypothetical protein
MTKPIKMRCPGVKNKRICEGCTAKEPHEKQDCCSYCAARPRGCVRVKPKVKKPRRPEVKHPFGYGLP